MEKISNKYTFSGMFWNAKKLFTSIKKYLNLLRSTKKYIDKYKEVSRKTQKYLRNVQELNRNVKKHIEIQKKYKEKHMIF